MVIATHGVFATYGFWPPNHPVGSWSDEVWAEHLRPFGDATKVSTSRSLARDPHDRGLVRDIREAMRYPPVKLDAEQRAAVVGAFAEVVAFLCLKVYALAVLPDHAHVVCARHRETIEAIMGFLKRAATRRLNELGIHPLREYRRADGEIPSPWVRGGWRRYIDRVDLIPGAIQYVRGNPVRCGLPATIYPFETPFVWVGH